MRSAHRLYRLQLALGISGALATALALGVAVSRLSFDSPSLGAFQQACRQLGLTELNLPALIVLSLSSLSVAVVALTARSAIRQLRARRAFLRGLPPTRARRLNGQQVRVFADPQPQAFCSGLLRPQIFVSSGALGLLDSSQLSAVVAHETHHLVRRDPLRLFVARALAEGLFFLPLLRQLAERYAALAELAADEAAVARGGSRRPLAAALLAFEGSPSAAVVNIAPERVDHLLGQRLHWKLPVALLLGTAVTLTGLMALVLRTAEGTAQASLELPAVLAQACMLAMSVAPVLIGAALLLSAKRAVTAHVR